jgi:SnoaL-like domain
MSSGTPDEWTIARSSIQDLMGRYAQAIDRGDIEAVLGLFVPEGTMVPHGLAEVRNHDQIRAFLQESSAARLVGRETWRLRHHVSSILIDAVGPSLATARSYFVAMSTVGADHWGVYRDELVATTSGEWRYRRREVEIVGASAMGWLVSSSALIRFDPDAPHRTD